MKKEGEGEKGGENLTKGLSFCSHRPCIPKVMPQNATVNGTKCTFSPVVSWTEQ